jgi:hypothetical protein
MCGSDATTSATAPTTKTPTRATASTTNGCHRGVVGKQQLSHARLKKKNIRETTTTIPTAS